MFSKTRSQMLTFRAAFTWPMPLRSMPLADTEQTAGLQSLTPDCLHDVGYAMFSVSPRFVVALPD